MNETLTVNRLILFLVSKEPLLKVGWKKASSRVMGGIVINAYMHAYNYTYAAPEVAVNARTIYAITCIHTHVCTRMSSVVNV